MSIIETTERLCMIESCLKEISDIANKDSGILTLVEQAEKELTLLGKHFGIDTKSRKSKQLNFLVDVNFQGDLVDPPFCYQVKGEEISYFSHWEYLEKLDMAEKQAINKVIKEKFIFTLSIKNRRSPAKSYPKHKTFEEDVTISVDTGLGIVHGNNDVFVIFYDHDSEREQEIERVKEEFCNKLIEDQVIFVDLV